MFCPNCGNQLNDQVEFCPSCGTKIVKQMDTSTTMTEAFSSQTKNFIRPIIDKAKGFLKNYKKQVIIVSSCVAVLIIGVVLFNKFYGFQKLSWDESYTAITLDYVTPNNLELGIKYDNREKIKDIKYYVTCGKFESDGLIINWDLSDASGTCKITASYKLRKITKEFIIIKPNVSGESEYAFDYEIDYDSDDDMDYDGLTNKQEKDYRTDVLLVDSDYDGLDDYYEVFTSKTDPIKADSDSDNLNDYDEIKLGLDPLKEDTKGDGIKDGSRSLSYTYKTDDINMVIEGTGNIASTNVEIYSNTKISNKPGLIDKLYSLYTEGDLSKADVNISYSDEDLVKFGIVEDNLSIYYYNEGTGKYEKLKTNINKDTNTLNATLSHFSNYVIGDSNLVKESSTTEILFVLDNSWSMYTNEQYKDITGKDYSGGWFSSSDLEGFDAEGIRFSLTSNLITKLSKKDYKIGLSEFRRDYANALVIGSSEKELKSKLNTMNGNFITTSEGTNISNALTSGINEFSSNSDNKYIVILTDGQDSSLSYQTNSIIKQANDNNVKICSIGFGGGSLNLELSNISNGTGCKFYSSGNVDGLTELFSSVGAELDDGLVDVDGDNENDGILIADSGFIVNRDGFSFGNYGTNYSSGGHCYGMATFAQLYYTKTLPLTAKSINPDFKSLLRSDIPGIGLALYGFGATNDHSSNPYDLNNTYFANYANLYDYKLKTNILKYTFGYDVYGEENPVDLYTLNGTLLAYSEKYRNDIVNSNLYDISESETKLNEKEQLEKWGVNYKTAESVLLNEDKMQQSYEINNDDKQMLNAIYAAFIKQLMQPHLSSSANLMVHIRNIFGTEDSYYLGGTTFIKILENRLNKKDVPVISSSFSGGLHAINAISLAQDIDDPNYYYIGVYDNNYPGEKRYVDVKCKFEMCTTVANDYYSESGQPIRFTPSLEYDLQYYNN